MDRVPKLTLFGRSLIYVANAFTLDFIVLF